MKYKYMYMLFTYLSNSDVFQPKCSQYTVIIPWHCKSFVSAISEILLL